MVAVGQTSGDWCDGRQRQRPGRQQDAGARGVAAQHRMKEEGQADEGEALCCKGTGRGRDRQGEHRAPEDVDRHHRIGELPLPQDEERPHHQRTAQFGHDHDRRVAVGDAIDAEDQQPERHSRQHRRQHVEWPVRVTGARQVTLGECEGDDSQGNIDREQDRPRPELQQGGAERRPRRQRSRDHGGIEAQSAAQHVARVDRPHQCGLHRHDGRARHALHESGGDQPGQRRCQYAAQGGDAEGREPEAVDVAIADDVGEGRHRQQRDHQGDLVGIDDPDRTLGGDGKILGDVGQRQIGHRIRQHGHHQADRDGRDGQKPRQAGRHAVVLSGGTRRFGHAGAAVRPTVRRWANRRRSWCAA